MRALVVLGLLLALCSVVEAGDKIPVSLVVVIDRAMSADDLTAVTSAMTEAIGTLDPDDRIAVIGAGDTASTEIALRPVRGANVGDRITAIQGSKSANMRAAFDRASSMIVRAKRGRRRILIITDRDELVGLDTRLDRLPDDVTVTTVGYRSPDAKTLRYAAGRGGGSHFSISDRNELVSAVLAVGDSRNVVPLLVVFVLDYSGSMEGPRIERAKELMRNTAASLTSYDTIAVIEVDDTATMVVDPQRSVKRTAIADAINRIHAEGGRVNLYPGLMKAREIAQGIEARKRLVIVLSDGDTPSDGLPELVADMRASRIEVSAVGVQGADRNLMKLLASAGRGFLLFLDDQPSLSVLPLR